MPLQLRRQLLEDPVLRRRRPLVAVQVSRVDAAHRVHGAEDVQRLGGGRLRPLAQGCRVVQHPGGSPMRGENQVALGDREAGDGHVGEVEGQRLPVIAVVEAGSPARA
jgi:hypothetical protein